MTANDHNTIGPRQQTANAGQPEACYDILAADGRGCIGHIEADYSADNPKYKCTRQTRCLVSGYKVWWYDCDEEPFFAVSDHGTARKALAAAKAYAKAATKAVRVGG